MTLYGWALWLAPLSAALAAAAAGLAARRRSAGDDREAWARRALAAAVVVHGVLLAWLAMAFLRGDLSLHYVWGHTRADYAWWYGLAGVWGGQAGTYLLWATIAVTAIAVEDARHRRSPRLAWPAARVVGLVVVALLSVAPVLLGLGRATADFHLAGGGSFVYDPGGSASTPLELVPDGFGLDRLLVTPFMLVHPPLQFAAYALVVVVFAYAVAHLVRGGEWVGPVQPWVRRAWFALTAALAIGGLWAYYVLSFGGFWAWDPVETADLLPWIALTALLHIDKVARRTGSLGVVAPAIGALPLVLVLFASFVTRTGLWVSVHAFLPTASVFTEPDAGLRLVAAIGADRAAAYASTLLLAAAFGVLAALAWRTARATTPAWRWVAGALGMVALASLLRPAAVAAVLTTIGRGLPLVEPVLGAGLVVVALGAVAVGPLLLREAPGLDLDPRRPNGALAAAALSLGLALLVTLVLLVLSVNGGDRSVYDERLPFVAAPILVLAAIAFPVVRPSPWRWLGPVGLALLGGLVLLARPGWSTVPWAAGPLCLALLAGAGRRLVETAEPGNPLRARVRAALLAAAGVLGLVQWSSPPPAVDLVVTSIAATPAAVVVGWLAAAATLVGVAVEGGRWPRWLTPVLGVAAGGHGVGALLAVAGAVVGRGRTRTDRPRPAASLGVPLVHVGVALLVLGAAFAFYAEDQRAFEQSSPLERGAPVDVAGHTLTLVDSSGGDADGDGRYETLTATVRVERAGRFVGERTLTLVWDERGSVADTGGYLPWDAPIHRTWRGDLYLNGDLANPLAVRIGDEWVVSGGGRPPVNATEIGAVAMTVKWVPGVNLVWGGISCVLVAMAVRLPSRRADRPRRTRRRHDSAPGRGS